MSPAPDLSAAALSPAQIVRSIRSHKMHDFTRAVPQPDKTVKVVFAPGTTQHFDFAVRALKESLAADGLALGPDDEDGNFLVLGRRSGPVADLPEGLLSDTPVEQG